MTSDAKRSGTTEDTIDTLNRQLGRFIRRYESEVFDFWDRQTAIPGSGLYRLTHSNLEWTGDRLPFPPAVIPRSVAATLVQCHAALRRSLSHVYTKRFGACWSRLLDGLGVESAVRRYVHARHPPRWLEACRPDIVLSGDSASLVEPNGSSNAGFFAEADLFSELFLDMPYVGPYLRDRGAIPMSNIATLQSHLRWMCRPEHQHGVIFVVIAVYADDLQDDMAGFLLLAERLSTAGFRAELVPVEDLDADRNGVYHRGRHIDVVYRYADAVPNPLAHIDVMRPIVDACVTGATYMFTDLDDAIAGNKTILGPLSEELDEGYLDQQTTATLRSFIPWTRVVSDSRATTSAGSTVSLLDYAALNREELVLKPGAGFCGRGVVIGTEVDQASWEETLQTAEQADEAWIVQRLIRSHTVTGSVRRGNNSMPFPAFVDYSYFGIGDAPPAAFIRKVSPVGNPTRRVKLAGTGPCFPIVDSGS